MSTVTMTSATANKMLRQLNDEKEYILQQEKDASWYIEAEGSDIFKPEYDYAATSEHIKKIDRKVCVLKHAINTMNTTTEITANLYGVSETMTIDVALVKMAQFNKQAKKLDTMRKRLPKTRKQNAAYGGTNNLVEYICANYDTEAVNKDYHDLTMAIAELQTQIDYANQTVQFEVED